MGSASGSSRHRKVGIALGVLATLGLIGYSIYKHIDGRNIPVEYDNDLEHFKYGSIASDADGSIPYWIFRAMPVVCSDLLPGGLQSLGLVQEPGMDRPIGFGRRVYKMVDNVGPNCAFCHTATVRETATSPIKVYEGASAHQFDILGFFQFLFKCGAHPAFTPANVVGAIDKMTRLSMTDRLLLRYYIVNATKQGLKAKSDKLAWISTRPEWGPGRVDTFNPYKVLGFGYTNDQLTKEDLSIGTADFMTIFDRENHKDLPAHWDGNNSVIRERNYSAAIGAGANWKDYMDEASLARIENWLYSLKPPPYPFPVDHARAEEGGVLYGKYCADCHDRGGSKVGKVEPLKSIGTDGKRTESFDQNMADRMNTIGTGRPWKFTHFHPTGGYENHTLEGAWLRAPLLHNGSVPTMRDLLEPPAKRPVTFYRGYDVYDQKKLGFVTDVASEGGRKFFLYDTTKPGNSNQGHTYGTELTDAEKDAIVEYMKIHYDYLKDHPEAKKASN